MRQTPEKLTEELRTLYGDNLKSMILYGSAVAGGYSKDYSDFNTLILLNRFDLATFKKSAQTLRAWTKAGNPSPLLLTWERLERSEDVFPIELLDIRENHRVLYGDDPFTELEIHADNLRLELERELKTNLIKLRQSYLVIADQPKEVRNLMIRSSSTFLVLFRSFLRLLNLSPLPPKSQVPQILSQHLSVDVEVFAYIERLKRKDPWALKEEVDPWIARYFQTVEKAADAVDAWIKDPTSPSEKVKSY
ncbi:MAG: hypothetical protein HY402_04155 [Elusimicrobia bacterium]|nr:hypothetical protein [Elusimicrobiota bacterium]